MPVRKRHPARTKPSKGQVAARADFRWDIFLAAVLFLLILLGAAFANVWLSQNCRVLMHSISELEGQIEREKETTRRLEVELASLKSPKRLESISLAELGLRAPTPNQIVDVQD
jgi:cell division protein FtsL